ncbi:hypothetical protein MKX01_019941 [Papaver californicum]|nr:hypothetical protein MKX01_019941 [Papaver californicum]
MSRRRGASIATNTRGKGNREASDVVEMIRFMIEGMTNQTAATTAIIQNQNGNHNAPPLREVEMLMVPTHKVLEKKFTDPLVVDKWKEDIYEIFVAMRCSLARKWWKNATIGLNENTPTYAQFCERFDARYFPSTPMLVNDCLDRYISLHRSGYFMTPNEDKSARKFENGLGGHIRGKFISHCFPTFQQVVIVLELRKSIG